MQPDARYRFWGRKPPELGHRIPIRAEAPQEGNSDDGVTVLRLYDPIDSWGGDWGVSAKEFATVLDTVDTDAIRLHINSPGGEVFEAFAILNQLREHKARVTTVVDGLAASAASFIAAGGDELVMGRNAELMIHDAWGLGIGNAADMRDLADRLDHLSDNIASVYAEKASGTTQTWRQAMLAETWYSAQEAVDAGLADRLAGSVVEQPKDRFDLKALFTYAGRGEAPAPAPIPAVASSATSITVGQVRQPRLEAGGVTFAVGDRVRVTIDPPHAPGQSTGTVAEVGGTAYGIVFDEMPEMGIHRWYTAAEVEPSATASPAEGDGMSTVAQVRHRMNARKMRAA